MSTTTAFGFTLTSSGQNHVRFFADPRVGAPAFWQGVNVTIGGVAVTNLTIEGNGSAISFVTPRYSEICGQGLCPGGLYHPIVIAQPNPGVMALSHTQRVTVEQSSFRDALSRVATFACPPNCPMNGRGLLYTKECVGYETGPQCFQTETAETCAFGQGDGCRSCPAGAICPGGDRAWPMPGYWSSGEDSTEVSRCDEPATDNCLGWSVSGQSVQCGEGIVPTSYKCSKCLNGYYREDGICRPCPDDDAVYRLVMAAAISGGTVAGVTIAVALVLLIGAPPDLKPGEKFRISTCLLRRAKFSFPLAAEIGIWTIICIQPIAQVGALAMPNLPEQMRQLFNLLRVFLFDAGGITPPACGNAPPLLSPLIAFVVELCIVLIFFSLLSKRLRRCICRQKSVSRGLALFRRVLNLGASLLFPLVCNSAISMVMCDAVTNGGETRMLLVINPYYVCYEGDHLPVGVLAWASLLIVGIGFPIVTISAGCRRVPESKRYCNAWLKCKRLRQPGKQLEKGEPKQEVSLKLSPHSQVAWGYLLNNDFRPEVFWFQPAHLLTTLAIASVGTTIPANTISNSIVRCVLLVFLLGWLSGALVVTQPFKAVHRWKLLPKLFGYLAALVASLLQLLLTLASLETNATGNILIAPPVVVKSTLYETPILVLSWVAAALCFGLLLSLVARVVFLSVKGCCCIFRLELLRRVKRRKGGRASPDSKYNYLDLESASLKSVEVEDGHSEDPPAPAAGLRRKSLKSKQPLAVGRRTSMRRASRRSSAARRATLVTANPLRILSDLKEAPSYVPGKVSPEGDVELTSLAEDPSEPRRDFSGSSMVPTVAAVRTKAAWEEANQTADSWYQNDEGMGVHVLPQETPSGASLRRVSVFRTAGSGGYTRRKMSITRSKKRLSLSSMQWQANPLQGLSAQGNTASNSGGDISESKAAFQSDHPLCSDEMIESTTEDVAFKPESDSKHGNQSPNPKPRKRKNARKGLLRRWLEKFERVEDEADEEVSAQKREQLLRKKELELLGARARANKDNRYLKQYVQSVAALSSFSKKGHMRAPSHPTGFPSISSGGTPP